MWAKVAPPSVEVYQPYGSASSTSAPRYRVELLVLRDRTGMPQHPPGASTVDGGEEQGGAVAAGWLSVTGGEERVAVLCVGELDERLVVPRWDGDPDVPHLVEADGLRRRHDRAVRRGRPVRRRPADVPDRTGHQGRQEQQGSHRAGCSPIHVASSAP